MTTSAYFYRIYGMVFLSEFRLEEAEPCSPAEPDVRIVSADLRRYVRPCECFRDFIITPDGDFFSFKGLGRFLVRSRSEIAVDLDPAFDVRLVGLALLGPVMAVLLHRAGFFVLHGSAVEMDGLVAVFLGDKGAGKSTTAAHLVTTGHPLVADDIIAIRADAELLEVPYGYPAMKLDAAMERRFAAGAGHVLEPNGGRYTDSKIRFRLHRTNRANPFPLGRLHVLSRGADNDFAAFDKSAALQALIRFSYFPRLGAEALEEGESAALFAKAASLVGRVHIGKLTVKDDLDALPQLVHFLHGLNERDYEAA